MNASFTLLSAFWHVEVCLHESLSLSLSPFSFSSPLVSVRSSRPSLIFDTRARVHVRAYRVMHTYALAQMNDISG